MNEQEEEFLTLFRELEPDEREAYIQHLKKEVAANE